jgi:hypothetical protein
VSLADVIATAIDVMRRESSADERELVQHMVAAGIAPSIAGRAVAFMPAAFAHYRLVAVSAGVPASYKWLDEEPHGEHSLWEEPVYLEALAACRGLDNATFWAVAGRSAEIGAANKAVEQGSKVEDLRFTDLWINHDLVEPQRGPQRAWWQWWRKPTPAAEPESELVATSTVELFQEAPRTAAALKRILDAHDLEANVERGVVRIAESGVTLEPILFACEVRRGLVALQLDVRAESRALGSRHLLASCSDRSATFAETVPKCLAKFQLVALHPMLAALVHPRFADQQVETETWGGFIAYVGNVVTQYDAPDALACDAVVDRIRDAWLATSPSHEVHWLSLFVLVEGERVGNAEVLVDNEFWEAGQTILGAHEWPASSTFYSCRMFITLQPANGTGATLDPS